jgi:hypothetical protein
MMGEEMPAKLNPPIKTNRSEGSAKVQLPAVVPGGTELPPALTVVVVVVVVVVVTVVPMVEVSVKVRVVV